MSYNYGSLDLDCHLVLGTLSQKEIEEATGEPQDDLENPRDGGAWWAAVYGVAQSQT